MTTNNFFFVFIAVNYNNNEFTEKYIKSVNSLPLDSNDYIKIIIVDNKSDNDDYFKLKMFCDTINSVELIRTESNLGYFKGLNKGIESINKNKNTLLIIGNNDLTFDRDFLKNLKKIKYNEKVLVIAPNIITMEGRQQNPHVISHVSLIEKLKCQIYYSNYYIGQTLRMINKNLKKILRRSQSLINNCGQMPIKRGVGACYILTPFFFNYFDKLDDRIFLWGEEALLSNQVESVSGITLYDPSIRIIHHESASVRSIESKKRYCINRESYKIYKKYL